MACLPLPIVSSSLRGATSRSLPLPHPFPILGSLACQKSSTWDSSDDDEWLSSRWSGYKSPKQLSRIRKTGVDVDVLRSIGEEHRAVTGGIHGCYASSCEVAVRPGRRYVVPCGSSHWACPLSSSTVLCFGMDGRTWVRFLVRALREKKTNNKKRYYYGGA